MGVLVTALTLALAWVLALFHVAPAGAVDADTFADTAMRWLLFLPGGFMFLASFVMHTALAKKTAAMIGWQTNGFQYEIGFVSLGLGLGGIVASLSSSSAWIPIAIAQGIFLALAGVNHVVEMVRRHNVSPGNTVILIYDFGLPISYLLLLLSLR